MRTSRYTPRHAKPALHPTRTTLSTGLTAVLLPLCMASPALADTAPSPSATATSATSTATMDGSPSASPTPAPAKQTTTMRISGPRGAVSPGSHAIGVRLLADERPVKNGYVRVERKLANGTWEYIGRLLTNEQGLGVGTFSFAKSTRVRAVYQGAATRTPGQTPEIVVNVVDFRQQAVRHAAAQNGKPYRYGSTGPNSFDCSGLVKYAFAKAGKSLPRTSRDMYRVAQKISQSAKKPGDLIFMSDDGRIGHVAVYAGNGYMWDAPRAGRNVSKRKIYTSRYYVGRVN
jgi:peptidoglycan DL-endopeptidase CwlO